MRCSVAKRLISDYIDGNLSTKKNLLLQQHLQSCSDCQQLSGDFKRIVSQARELERLRPSRDAWLKIRARLKEVNPKGRTRIFAEGLVFGFQPRQTKLRLALSLVVLLAVMSAAIFGLRYWMDRETGTQEDLQRYALAHLIEAERHYKIAIEALNKAISDEKMELNPQLAEVFQKNLNIIDASIKACYQAIQQQPDNLQVRSYLLTIYKEKVDLLNELMKMKTKSL